MSYAQKIRSLRQDSDKTQEEIAFILKTSQSYYAQYENSKRPLPIEHLYTLCKYYRVSADYILGLPDGMPYPKRQKTKPTARIKGSQAYPTTHSAKRQRKAGRNWYSLSKPSSPRLTGIGHRTRHSLSKQGENRKPSEMARPAFEVKGYFKIFKK